MCSLLAVASARRFLNRAMRRAEDCPLYHFARVSCCSHSPAGCQQVGCVMCNLLAVASARLFVRRAEDCPPYQLDRPQVCTLDGFVRRRISGCRLRIA